MGNTLAQPVAAAATKSGDARYAASSSGGSGSSGAGADVMAELVPMDAVYQSALGGGRLFRTCSALIDETKGTHYLHTGERRSYNGGRGSGRGVAAAAARESGIHAIPEDSGEDARHGQPAFRSRSMSGCVFVV